MMLNDQKAAEDYTERNFPLILITNQWRSDLSTMQLLPHIPFLMGFFDNQGHLPEVHEIHFSCDILDW